MAYNTYNCAPVDQQGKMIKGAGKLTNNKDTVCYCLIFPVTVWAKDYKRVMQKQFVNQLNESK